MVAIAMWRRERCRRARARSSRVVSLYSVLTTARRVSPVLLEDRDRHLRGHPALGQRRQSPVRPELGDGLVHAGRQRGALLHEQPPVVSTWGDELTRDR